MFSDTVHEQFPRFGLTNWFEQSKEEADVPGSLVKWEGTRDRDMRAAFRSDFSNWVMFAP